MVAEFDLIEKYFAPLAGEGGLDLLDDAAIISPKANFDLILTKDMLIESVHFFGDDDPASIAWKILSVNMSDLAAKGASPVGYLMGIGFPNSPDDAFLQAFTRGLDEAQRFYGIQLLGGDTVKTPKALTLSLTAIGELPTGTMVKRRTASVGDSIYVSGTLGDSAIALAYRQKDEVHPALDIKYTRPTARMDLSPVIRTFASSCADVSDGLIADLSHILCNQGAKIEMDALPLSDQARQYIADNRTAWNIIYSGGDDYELVFTIPACHEKALLQAISDKGLTCVTKIGVVTAEKKIILLDKSGSEMPLQVGGYQHF